MLLAAAAPTPDTSALSELFKIIPEIKNQLALAAFAIAAILSLFGAFLRRPTKAARNVAWGCAGAITLLGVIGWFIPQGPAPGLPLLYHVRVTVLDPQEIPVDDARVWSSLGGEAKKVAGEWELDIPASSKPATGKLTVFAERANAFQKGKGDVELGNIVSIATTVTLGYEPARVRGTVLDEAGAALEGARVMVIGHGDVVVTPKSGYFELQAHAPSGKQVLLHAEKSGYDGADQWHPAGDDPAVLTLRRKQR